MDHPQLKRLSGSPLLMLNATSVSADGLSRLISTSTYSSLDTLQPGAPPSPDGSAWFYRTLPREKLLVLTVLAAGADNETITLDVGLYPRLTGSDPRYALGQCGRLVATLGTLTHASMSVEPFTGTAITSATFRHADDITWTYRDSDEQMFSSGEGENQSRRIYLDLTGVDLVAVAWQARSGSASRVLVGAWSEGA